MIDPGHPRLSIQRQCALVSISRSAFYYQPAGETPLNLELMRMLDHQFLDTPWYGARQMARCLRRQGDRATECIDGYDELLCNRGRKRKGQ